MKELRALLEDLGFQDVKTYIQSGNVVCRRRVQDAAGLADKIRTEIGKRSGFEPRVMMLEAADIEKAVASNPFSEAESAPRSLHVYFLASAPENPDLKGLEKLKENERFRLRDTVFYLHAPDGIGRSRLAAKLEERIGVAMTGRNWRTVSRIAEMARDAN